MRYWLFIFLFLSVSGSAAAQPELGFSFADTMQINRQLVRARRLFLSGHTDSAASVYLSMRDRSQYMLYTYGVVKSMIGLGNTQADVGAYDKALQTYHAAMTLCHTRETQKLLTTLYNNAGNLYTFWGDFEQSMHQYEQAIRCADTYGAELSVASLYNNISIALNHLNQPRKALYYLDKGAQLALESGDYYALADIYNNKGFAYATLKENQKSAASFRAAIRTATDYGYLNTCYSAYVNMGIIALNDNHPEEAIAHFREAGAIKGNINPYYQNQRLFALGATYLKLQKYAPAIAYLLRSRDICEQLHLLPDLATVHQLLADAYAETGAYQKAFIHRGIEQALQDSIHKKETLDAVSRMEVKYRTALKDKELAAKQLTINRQQSGISRRNQWIAIVSVCLLLLCLAVVLQRRSYRHRQKLKNEQLINMERQQELQVIKAIMRGEEKERSRLAREIHDSIMVRFSAVKMNLSAAAGQPSLQPEKLRPLLRQLDEATDDLRRTAHNLMPDMLLEDGLPEAVCYFCNNLGKDVPLRIVFQSLGEIPRFEVSFELSVYRVIQELVQNVLKHAAATEAIVQLSFENQLLSVIVEDNGCGIRDAGGKEDKGLGLKSIRARVISMGGRMEIESEPGVGTSVHLEFDVSL